MNVLKYGQGTKKGFKKDGRFEKVVDKTLRNEDMIAEAGTLTDAEAAWPSSRAGAWGAGGRPPTALRPPPWGERALPGALGWEPLGRVAHSSHQMSRMSRVATMA